MKEYTVTESNLNAAYEVANDETKKVLDALFGKQQVNKPSLDDYKSIKTYEDACEALDVTPIYSQKAKRAICEHINGHWDFRQNMPKHILALMKLETISRALWGRNWEPKPDAEGKTYFYWPWFYLYTKKEVDDMSQDDKGALLSASAHHGANAGFGFLHTAYRSSYSLAHGGFRLCQETEEKAEYFGKQFKEIWAEYLAFNFTVGDPIVKQ